MTDIGEPKKIVYLVDDEPRVLAAMADSVRAIGVIVKEFSSADECLSALREHPCNLLITDINMPGMDGFSLLAQARQSCPQVPIIMMSGVADIQTANRALHEGATHFIEKPLDEQTVLPLLEATLFDGNKL